MEDHDKLEKLRIRLQAISKGEECGDMRLARELLVEYFGYDERSHEDWMSGA